MNVRSLAGLNPNLRRYGSILSLNNINKLISHSKQNYRILSLPYIMQHTCTRCIFFHPTLQLGHPFYSLAQPDV